MKVIIAGSRTITNYPEVVNAIEASGFVFKMKEAVCGMARVGR